jgi:hypothetical protein
MFNDNQQQAGTLFVVAYYFDISVFYFGGVIPFRGINDVERDYSPIKTILSKRSVFPSDVGFLQPHGQSKSNRKNVKRNKSKE